ncbi:MAG TPA: hypothetical protein VH393_08110 [Ktedonobacterales bacterium]
MSQRPDDFYANLGQFGASDELRPVYERLDADARAWSATVGDETPLIAFARSLPRRSREETIHMQSQPGRPEWEATQRLPHANPDYQPRQRPSRLRTWVAVIAATLVVALLGGSFYLLQASRNNGTPATPTATTAQATNTPLPTATATPTPLPTVTSAQFGAACPNVPAAGNIYQIGDLYVAISLTGFDYPSSKLPDGTPLKPFNLKSSTDKYHGLPRMPEVNPDLKNNGFWVTVCNASKNANYRVDGITVRIDQFTPFTGDLNTWQYCDTYYRNGHEDGGGCGGGYVYDERLNAVFAASAGAGETVPAAFVVAGILAPLPLTRKPGQSLDMNLTMTPPTTPGTYHFSFSVKVDGVNLPFALLTDDLLLGPARKWNGAECLRPEMQSQIPAGSTDAYICPEP